MPSLAELEELTPRRAPIPRLASSSIDCSALTLAARRHSTRRIGWASMLGGATMYLKREDLAHTGAHKINNAVGQALLAQRMGKRRIIAENRRRPARRGDGHRLRHAGPRVRRLHGRRRRSPPGARTCIADAAPGRRSALRPTGSRTLKDAINEAIRDWVTNVSATHYLLGSAVGPHPYPTLVRRLSGGYRPGDAASDSGSPRRPARPGGRLRWGGQQRDRHVRPVRVGRRRYSSSGSRRVALDWHRGAMRRRSRPARWASCTGRGTCSCRTTTGRSWRPIACPPGSTIRASGRSTPTCSSPGRVRVRGGHRRGGARGIPGALPGRGDHPGPRAGPRAGLPAGAQRRMVGGYLIVVNLSGRGDKDVALYAEATGRNLDGDG